MKFEIFGRAGNHGKKIPNLSLTSFSWLSSKIFFRGRGKTYCYANFYFYANFSIVFRPKLEEVGQAKSLREASCLRGACGRKPV